MAFRESFKLATRETINWFPGHMNKGLKQMQQKLRNVDCIIEVHDARIPFSGRNVEFQNTITGDGVKPHILVLNKKDLTNSRDHADVKHQLRERQSVEHVLFTNCKQQQCMGIKRILPLAKDLVNDSGRYNRANSKEYNIMIIGVPNVGKSSLLNVLRNTHLKKKKATRVGGEAGITRSVMEKIKISENPPVYMIDTPGITQPRVDDDETGMKLALVGCLPDHLVGEDLIADFLLYWLNKQKRFEYVNLVGLTEPNDNISQVLGTFGHKMQVYRKVKQYNGELLNMVDLLIAAKKFIQLFRTGQLGAINLDK